MCRPLVQVINLGCQVSYRRGLDIQRRCLLRHFQHQEQTLTSREQVAAPHVLLLLEHSPVYTVGIRRGDYPERALSELREAAGGGAEVCESDRGGLITFHGPGQLVAYPIIDLRAFPLTVRRYVCGLESCIVTLCRRYNIHTARTTADTGVWIGENKIAAVGIHVSRHVTSHGVAINCNTDLAWFSHIVPCGLAGKGVTSFTQQLGSDISTQQVMQPFVSSFSEHFQCDISPHDALSDCQLEAILGK